MEGNQEQEHRGRLRLAASQYRTRFPNIIVEIDGIIYDTNNPTTRLLGEINIATASYVGESLKEQRYSDSKQLWRTKDGKYFFYGIGGVEAIDNKTAHKAMDEDYGYRRYLTDSDKKEIEEEDEKRVYSF